MQTGCGRIAHGMNPNYPIQRSSCRPKLMYSPKCIQSSFCHGYRFEAKRKDKQSIISTIKIVLKILMTEYTTHTKINNNNDKKQ